MREFGIKTGGGKMPPQPQARRPAPPRAERCARPPLKVVIMTFIMDEFSGGPWTKAVQGPK